MVFVGELRLFAAAIAALVISSMPLQSAPPPCSVPAPSARDPGIPDDVCGTSPSFDEFGNMAWQTFKTLVWPSSASHRGQPDDKLKISDTSRPLVFESYKPDWEALPASKKRPVDWGEYAKTAPVCKNASTMVPPLDERSMVLAASHRFYNLDQLYRHPDGKIKLPDGEFKDILHVLVAQNGSLVRYLTAFDEKAFNAILKNELYRPIGLQNSEEEPTEKTKAELGTVTIKTAWIELDEQIPNHDRFYFRAAWLQEPFEGTCHLTKVGLVGFHIAHKTERSPQWLWASFEHIGNVPHVGEKRQTTFNNGAGTIDPHPPKEAWVPIAKIPPPYNVARVREIPEAIRTVNKNWHDALEGSVWTNYELVAVQWPRHLKDPKRKGVGRDGIGWRGAYPTPPCQFGAEPNVSNSVIETFLQPYNRCDIDLTCMSCHNAARNYDFIWSIPLAHIKEPASDTSGAVQKGLSTLRELLVPQKQ